MDLLLGGWAAENVPKLSLEELDQYERILNSETLDLYNYVAGKDPVPEDLQGPVMDMLQAYALSAPLGKASPEVSQLSSS